MKGQFDTIWNSAFSRSLRDFFHQQTQKLWFFFSPASYVKKLYRNRTGKELSLQQPQTFQEKLQWMKLYDDNPLIPVCLDKYRARTYVESLGLAKLLNTCYDVYPHPAWIDFDLLPNAFSLVATNGKNRRIHCESKRSFSMEEAQRQLRRWMRQDYALTSGVKAYSFIKPRILAEKFRLEEAGRSPKEYGFLCFHGRVDYCVHITAQGDKRRFHLYLPDMTPAPFSFGEEPEEQQEAKAPLHLEEMKRAAEKISGNLPYARVNFYHTQKRPIFASVEIFEDGLLEDVIPDEYQKTLGDKIHLPERSTGTWKQKCAALPQKLVTALQRGWFSLCQLAKRLAEWLSTQLSKLKKEG